MARKDLTNQVFGTLKAIEFDEERYERDKLNPDIKRLKTFWKCECLKCGRIVSVQTSNLTSGNSKGCGCDKFENSIENRNIILDHIDRNRLNCSKSNLRICSTSDNAKNIFIPSNNTSGIIGVSWCKQWNKWRAFVCIEGKYISLGYYKDKNDAIIARLKGEKEYYKEFAPQKHLFDLYLN